MDTEVLPQDGTDVLKSLENTLSVPGREGSVSPTEEKTSSSEKEDDAEDDDEEDTNRGRKITKSDEKAVNGKRSHVGDGQRNPDHAFDGAIKMGCNSIDISSKITLPKVDGNGKKKKKNNKKKKKKDKNGNIVHGQNEGNGESNSSNEEEEEEADEASTNGKKPHQEDGKKGNQKKRKRPGDPVRPRTTDGAKLIINHIITDLITNLTAKALRDAENRKKHTIDVASVKVATVNQFSPVMWGPVNEVADRAAEKYSKSMMEDSNNEEEMEKVVTENEEEADNAASSNAGDKSSSEEEEEEEEIAGKEVSTMEQLNSVSRDRSIKKSTSNKEKGPEDKKKTKKGQKKSIPKKTKKGGNGKKQQQQQQQQNQKKQNPRKKNLHSK
jgi:hypothetical protein